MYRTNKNPITQRKNDDIENIINEYKNELNGLIFISLDSIKKIIIDKKITVHIPESLPKKIVTISDRKLMLNDVTKTDSKVLIA